MKRIPQLLLIPMLFLCMNCEDDKVSPGMESTVHGIVYDSINDLPVAGVSLFITEWNQKPGLYGNWEYIGKLDSAVTDAYGSYSMNYSTSGKGDSYQMEMREKERLWDYNTGRVYLNPYEEIQEIDLKAMHLYPVMLNIRIEEDVKHMPIRIRHAHNGYQKLETKDSLYRIRMYMNKNGDQFVKFSRSNAPNEYQRFSYRIPATQSSTETEVEITIRESDFN